MDVSGSIPSTHYPCQCFSERCNPPGNKINNNNSNKSNLCMLLCM